MLWLAVAALLGAAHALSIQQPLTLVVGNEFLQLPFQVESEYNASDYSIRVFATGMPASYPWLFLDEGADQWQHHEQHHIACAVRRRSLINCTLPISNSNPRRRAPVPLRRPARVQRHGHLPHHACRVPV